MPIANPDKNNKARVGNVTHPFTKRDIEAGKIIFGDETARDLDSTHPLRQTSVTGSPDSATYNALQEFKNAQTNFGANTPASVVNPNQNINPNAASVALPEVNIGVFGSGSYENPTATTNPNANDNAETVNPYSFMDDLENIKQWKEDNPDKNVFGFNKRNAESLKNRIDKAREQGKEAKVARLTKKLNNFQDNQARRAADGDTYTRNESVEKDGKTETTRSGSKNKGSGIGNIIKSIF